MKSALTLLAALSLGTPKAEAFCFDAAGERYGVSPALLRAIARVESGLNPAAVNDSHEASTGSVDLGLMQINSAHLPRLSAWGISREKLLADACLNVMVGAWLLVHHMVRNGHDWNGIGSYNAGCTRLKGQACTDARNSYAWKVFNALKAQEPARPRTPFDPSETAAAPTLRSSIRSLQLQDITLAAQAADINSKTDSAR